MKFNEILANLRKKVYQPVYIMGDETYLLMKFATISLIMFWMNPKKNSTKLFCTEKTQMF